MRALSTLLAVLTASFVHAQPAAPDGLARAALGETVLYAHPAALDTLAVQVGRAQATALRVLGGPLPPLALAYTPDAGSLADLDLRPFHAAGLPVRASIEPAGPVGVLGRVLLAAGASALRVYAVMDSTSGFEAGDRLVETAGRPVATVADLQAALAAAPGGAVEIQVVRNGERRVVPISPGTFRRLNDQPMAALSVEADVLVAYVDARARQRCGDCYAPDWIRTAVRQMAAPEPTWPARASFVEQSPALRLPFEAFLADTSRTATSSLETGDAPDAAGGRFVGRAVTRATPDQRATMQRARAYLAQSLSLGRFLVATRGAGALGAVLDAALDGALDGATPAAALAAAGLPPTATAAEQAWSDWLGVPP